MIPSHPTHQPRVRPWRALRGFIFTLIATAAFSAESPKKVFDIPAQPGDKALKRFAAQAGVEVVFGTATAAEVTTNAVKGEYLPREAIALLLEGTGLIVVPNKKTGALTVSRDPNVQRAAQDKSCDRPIDVTLALLSPNPQIP